MTDKTTLSKRKKIFEVYPTVDGIAVEPRSIVYSNSSLVYIKTHGSPYLDYVHLNRIYKKDDPRSLARLGEAINTFAKEGYKTTFYFWDAPDDNYDACEHYKEAVKEFKLEREKSRLEWLLNECEKVKKQIAELEGES